jgi:ABC-type transporter Mla MlaB component
MVTQLLHTVQEHPEGWAHVSLSGVINEHSALDSLHFAPQSRTCLLDVSAVTRLNSAGVRDWLCWLEEQATAGVSVILIDCSKAVVGQLNLTQAFGEHAQIFSVCIPYFCEPCELEQSSVLMASDWTASSGLKIPDLTCGNCESSMVFDDIEGMYFRFVEWARLEADMDWVSARLTLARQGDMDEEAIPMEASPAPTYVPHENAPPVGSAEPPSVGIRLDAYYYLAVGALVFLLAVVLYHLLKL